LELAYPGCEMDKQKLQAWREEHPPNDDNDKVFHNMLDGLRNKDAIFFRNRSHPNVKALDALDLDHLGWERDFQAEMDVHCCLPALLFPDKLHMMKEKQNVFVGNKSHRRLQKLYDLQLTYPDHDKDLEQIEEWHIHNADNAKKSLLFEEALDAMREQQQLFQETTKDASSSLRLINTVPLDSDMDTDMEGSFYGIPLKEASKMEKFCKSINISLNGLASQKEKLFAELARLSRASKGCVVNKKNASTWS
jgi:hypothetical protein